MRSFQRRIIPLSSLYLITKQFNYTSKFQKDFRISGSTSKGKGFSVDYYIVQVSQSVGEPKMKRTRISQISQILKINEINFEAVRRN